MLILTVHSFGTGDDKLIRRSYWLDLDDRAMVNGIGASLRNDEKRAHLIDLRREHLIDWVCFRKSFRPRNRYTVRQSAGHRAKAKPKVW